MSAETSKGIFLTGIVAGITALLIVFVLVVFTGIGDKILRAVNQEQVDAAIEQSLEQYRIDHTVPHEKEHGVVIVELDTIKDNQVLILEAIKTNK